jgi:hypothetical protein
MRDLISLQLDKSAIELALGCLAGFPAVPVFQGPDHIHVPPRDEHGFSVRIVGSLERPVVYHSYWHHEFGMRPGFCGKRKMA